MSRICFTVARYTQGQRSAVVTGSDLGCLSIAVFCARWMPVWRDVLIFCDCEGDVCDTGICLESLCNDFTRKGRETWVSGGGPQCPCRTTCPA